MEAAPKNLYIVIPAGGIGTRFWPRSREKNPKQFLKLSTDRSIIQQAVDRLKGVVPPERIFVVAHDRYKQDVFEHLPNFLPKNYISEPERRGTSGAIGLSALFIKKIDPTGVVHFLNPDDYIKNIPRFRRMILAAAKVADEDKTLVVYGLKPSYPATGFGYIKITEKLKEIKDIEIFRVEKFVEKPDEETAKKFLAQGNYYWHGSGFTARIDVLFGEMRKYWPKGYRVLEKIEKLAGLPADREEGEIATLYHQIEKDAIEYSVLERSDRVMMATLESTWQDIGSWKTLYDISAKDKNGNVVIKYGKEGELVNLGAKNCIVQFDDQLIALIGVEDLIVVDTSDTVLVCKKDQSQRVKELVDLLKEKKKDKYL